jgi:hypothetical protein
VPGAIPGISKSSLWQAWKSIRVELRQATIRDAVDFLDYDIEPDIWIRRLLRQVSSGVYEPHSPIRFTLAKTGGFSRRLTVPAIPDIVLFRAIADFVHRKAQKYQQPHVYYRRADSSHAAKAAALAAKLDLQKLATLYRFNSAKSYRNWRDYEQYRKLLILKKLYRFLVVSDITNFFDSVLHSEVSNAFRNYPIPSRLIGLLFFLLERLAIRADYSDSPRIGLPVDQFECSRTIANLVLFPHDRRVVERVGKEAYVRWMDDQVIGVNSKAEGLKTIAAIGASLSNHYLTANAKKTRVLSLKQAKLHYHLEINARLDAVEQVIENKSKPRRALVRELAKIWRAAKRNKDHGEWEKIQKRFYRLAGLTKARFLRRCALRDLLSTPTLTERIADYVRCSGTSRDYLSFLRRVLRHREQIHEDVELVLLENLLRLELSGKVAASVVRMAMGMMEEISESKRNFVFSAPACLLFLRFGNKRVKGALKRCFRDGMQTRHSHLVRAAAITYATYGSREFAEVRNAASLLLNNPLALMVRMVWRLKSLKEVPERFKARLTIRRDSVSGRHYLDMRTYVAARLLALNRRKAVRQWLKEWAEKSKKKHLSTADRRLVASLVSGRL